MMRFVKNTRQRFQKELAPLKEGWKKTREAQDFKKDWNSNLSKSAKSGVVFDLKFLNSSDQNSKDPRFIIAKWLKIFAGVFALSKILWLIVEYYFYGETPSRGGIIWVVVPGITYALFQFYFEPINKVRNFGPYIVHRRYEISELGSAAGRKSLQEVTLTDSYRNSGYRHFAGHHGEAIWSPDLNHALIHGLDISIKKSEKLTSLPQNASEFRKIAVVSAVMSGKPVYNDELCTLATDMIFAETSTNRDCLASQYAEIRKTDYFALMSSDYMTLREIRYSRDGDVALTKSPIYDGFDLFTEKRSKAKSKEKKERVLRPLGSTGEGVAPSACSNVIGVSTLIVSKDNFVYLTQQSSQNIQSAGLVAPSGSGSVDFADLGKIGLEGTLIDLVKYAARRESLEEGGLPLDVSEQFNQIPLGFARMLHVGAKPEFFFFGKVHLTIAEIKERRAYSKKEGLFTKENFNVEHAILLENINAFKKSWSDVSEDIRRTIGAKLSMPLELILLFMDEAMKHDEQTQKLLELLRQG
jgi:hypothetical protein